MKAKPRRPIPAETLTSLARMFADYRLNGCRSGGAAAIQVAVRKAAKSHGFNYSELWADVHRLAYEIIDAA